MAKTYKKIPGVGTGVSSFQAAARSRIFTASDHLLIMQSTFFTEEYKRIFFRDIRYVEIRPTTAQVWMAVVSGILTVLIGLLYFLYLPVVAVVIFSSPFVVWFVLNLILGPTCKCYIGTKVQTLELPAPKRVKKVATLIAFLRAQTVGSNPVA